MGLEKNQVAVSIAPSVLFAIGEIYQRRNETVPSRVVGAIFGNQSAEAASKIIVSHCFVVPHSEVGDQISINSEYYKQRSELHKKCYGKQSVILGWFSVTQEGAIISEKNTQFINDSFGREVLASGQSGFSIHLNIHVSANGVIERCTEVTELSSKATFPVSSSVLFKSNEIFAGTTPFLYS